MNARNWYKFTHYSDDAKHLACACGVYTLRRMRSPYKRLLKRGRVTSDPLETTCPDCVKALAARTVQALDANPLPLNSPLHPLNLMPKIRMNLGGPITGKRIDTIIMDDLNVSVGTSNTSHMSRRAYIHYPAWPEGAVPSVWVYRYCQCNQRRHVRFITKDASEVTCPKCLDELARTTAQALGQEEHYVEFQGDAGR